MEKPNLNGKFIFEVYALEAGPLTYSTLLDNLNVTPRGNQKSFNVTIDKDVYMCVRKMDEMVHIGVQRKALLRSSIHNFIMENDGAMILSDDPDFKLTSKAIELSKKLDKSRRPYHT